MTDILATAVEETSSDEAHDNGDQTRAVHLQGPIALALSIAGLFVVIADWNTPTATLVLAAAIIIAPGLLLTGLLRFDIGLSVALAIPSGLAVLALLSRALLYLDWYRPVPLAVGICVVTAGMSALDLARARSSVSGTWRSERSRWAAMAGITRTMRNGRTWECLVAVSLAGWVIAMVSTSGADPQDWGLLGSLSPAWYVGLGAALVAVLVGFACSSPTWAVPLAGGVVLVVLYLYVTGPTLYSVPRFAWTYKHIGLADYLAVFHRNDRSKVDIYHAWPSFFSSMGVLADTTSTRGLVTLARWWPVLTQVTGLLLVRQIYLAFVADARLVWTGVGVFVLGNWVGQDYFSPQSVGFVVGLGLIALLLGRMMPPLSAVRPGRLLVRAPQFHARRRDVVLAVALWSAVVVTHQLSPYLLLVGLVGAVPLLGVRPIWLPVMFVAIAAAYAMLNIDIVLRQGVGDDLGSLVQNVESRSAQPGRALGRVPEFDRYYRAGVALSGMISIGFLLGLRATRRLLGRRFLGYLAFALGPVLVLAAESYGQEGILRAYLFCLPWLAFGAAVAVDRLTRRRWMAPLVAVATTIALVLAVVVGFVRDQDFRVEPSDVAMATWYEQNSPSGSALISAGVPALPGKVTAFYARHSYFGLPEPSFTADGEIEAERTLRDVAASIRADTGEGEWFMGFGPTITARTVFEGYLTSDEIDELRAAVSNSPEWIRVFRDGSSELFRWAGA